MITPESLGIGAGVDSLPLNQSNSDSDDSPLKCHPIDSSGICNYIQNLIPEDPVSTSSYEQKPGNTFFVSGEYEFFINDNDQDGNANNVLLLSREVDSGNYKINSLLDDTFFNSIEDLTDSNRKIVFSTDGQSFEYKGKTFDIGSLNLYDESGTLRQLNEVFDELDELIPSIKVHDTSTIAGRYREFGNALSSLINSIFDRP
jgi:hypothetical protein